MREPSRSSLKCPSVCGEHRVPPPHLSTRGSPCAHLLRRCSTAILLSFDRSPHLITSCCPALPSPPLSRKGLAQYGRSRAPDLLPLSLLRRLLVLFGRSSPTRLVPASAPTHRISGHRQRARGNRSSRAGSEYVSLVQFVFLSALSVAYYYLYFL